MGQDIVEIHLFAAARAAVGEAMLTAKSGVLSTILDDISTDHPAFAAVRPRCSYLLDGTTVHGDVDVPSGSRVDVLPPFAGG
jgi:molybdopterin converting factor small subunit